MDSNTTPLETLAAWEDIRISRKEDLLILEINRIHRILDLSKGAPRTVSLQTANGTELASANNPICDLGFIGMHEAGKTEVPWRIKSVCCRKKQRDIFEAQHLTVEISMEEPVSGSLYKKIYILYPQTAAIGMECSLRTPVTPNIYWSHRNRLSQTVTPESTGDALQLAPSIQPRQSV